MRLTPLAKAFIAVVVLAVIGFATWHYKGDAIKEWAGGERKTEEVSKADFDNLNDAPGDPGAECWFNRRQWRFSRHRAFEPAAGRRHQHLGRPCTWHRFQ